MPLHDWNGRKEEWPGVHDGWAYEIVRFLKPRLPEPYRARLGAAPRMIRLGTGDPDAQVERISEPSALQAEDSEALAGAESDGAVATLEPDAEVAVPVLQTDTAVYVSHRGRLIAAIELVSPRNKDRPSKREATFARYSGYLEDGVHLVLIDAHPSSDRETLADRFSDEFQLGRPRLPAPYAAVYRVGEEADPGRYLAVWQFPLSVGGTLPVVPVPLTVHRSVMLDLEATYAAACEVAYLD